MYLYLKVQIFKQECGLLSDSEGIAQCPPIEKTEVPSEWTDEEKEIAMEGKFSMIITLKRIQNYTSSEFVKNVCNITYQFKGVAFVLHHYLIRKYV